MKHLLAAVLLIGVASPALAATVVTTGNTTGKPTWNRPLTTTTLSGVGTAVPYDVVAFTVDTAGSYIINLTTTTALYDPFLALYSGVFNPTSQFTNLLDVNDDFPTGNLTQSQITRTLATGITYRAVVTGFDNLDFGAYTLTFSGPGNITVGGGAGAVPEPATWLMMIGGFGLVGAAMRRRREAGTVTA